MRILRWQMANFMQIFSRDSLQDIYTKRHCREYLQDIYIKRHGNYLSTSNSAQNIHITLFNTSESRSPTTHTRYGPISLEAYTFFITLEIKNFNICTYKSGLSTHNCYLLRFCVRRRHGGLSTCSYLCLDSHYEDCAVHLIDVVGNINFRNLLSGNY